MSDYRVTLSPDAAKFYRNADRPLAKRLARCFAQLERDPRNHPNIKRLSGPLRGLFRYRVGDHRVVYRMDEEGRIVIVVVIAHRSRIYD